MKKDAVIILGTAHRLREPGKCSPDKKFREAVYSREIVKELAVKLKAYGYKVFIDLEENDIPKNMQTPSCDLERQRELALRVNYVNELCKQYGKDNCLYVSIHNDAIGTDGKWHDCGGWSCFTTPGKTKSDNLAECLYDAATTNLRSYSDRFAKLKVKGEYGKKQTPIRTDMTDGDRDKESNLYVLKNTKCAAVLTENLFQDSKADVEYLLSDEGRHCIERLHLEGIIKYIDSM